MTSTVTGKHMLRGELLETVKSLDINDVYMLVTGIVIGTAARLFTLRVDMRQIPSYPSAYFNTIIFGFIASALGAIAVPAIAARDFTAVTFLTLAVTQFREVRTIELESLGKLEHTEYAERGKAYIDGISKTFESRNYISLVSALLSVLVMKLVGLETVWLGVTAGALAGIAAAYLCYRFTKGRTVGQIFDIAPGIIDVRGSELYVDNMFVTNYLGTDRSRELFKSEGLAVVVSPRTNAGRVTLENYGQRKAILFEAVRALGIKRYKFMHRNFKNGKVIIALVPILRDPERLTAAVRNTPILENSRKIERIMKTSFGGKNG